MADSLRELWELPLSSEERSQLCVKLGLMRLEGKDPSVFFNASTPEAKADVLRALLAELGGGSSVATVDDDSEDLTYKTVFKFSTPCVPELDALENFIVSKPDGVKILVSPRTFKDVRSFDTVDLFVASTGARCVVLEDHLRGCVLPRPETGVTELSFIQAWDNLINTPVKLFIARPFTKYRNTNLNTGTDNSIPDCVGYVGAHFSLWLAEEKPEEVGDPRDELVTKRKWCYKSVPYILGYYARGLIVTLVALYQTEGEVNCRDLATFDLGRLSDRIRLFMVAFNVSRVLAGLHDICMRDREETEFAVVKTITSGKSVRLAGTEVIKGYSTAGKRKRVWEIYSQLKGCPNMETCLSRKPVDQDNLEVKRRKMDEFSLGV